MHLYPTRKGDTPLVGVGEANKHKQRSTECTITTSKEALRAGRIVQPQKLISKIQDVTRKALMSSVYSACIGNSIPRTHPPPVLHITYQQPTSETTNKRQQGSSLLFQSHKTRPDFLCTLWVPNFHQLSSLLTHRNHSTQLSIDSTDPQSNNNST